MAEKEYIEREAVMQKFADHVKRSNNSDFAPAPTWNQAVQIVEDFPAADVRPVVRGKWEDVEVTYVADKTTLPFERISSMRCNQCNRYHTEIYYYGNPTEMAHFCPNCVAEMEES